jgi:hypothetical protein
MLTINAQSFTNKEASSAGLEICPSQVANHFNMKGRKASFKERSNRGAIKANKGSTLGNLSTKDSRKGSFSFNALTSVREDTNATGIDQKKHSVMLAARLRSLPVLRALLGRPTLSQNTSLGSGATSTVIVVAVTRERRVRPCSGSDATDVSRQRCELRT